MLAVLWPCCGRIAGLAARQLGRVVAPRLSPGQPSQPLCQDIIHCIVTQIGSSPFHASALFFFFFHYFSSSHSSYWKTIKEKKYFFSFHFPVNQINLLKFILFYFSNFTHCKTLKNKFLHIIFFFHLIPDHFVQNYRTPKVIFLDPNVQRFLSYAIHQAYNLNHNSYNIHNNHTIT